MKKLDEIRAIIPQEVKDQVDETKEALDRAYYLGADDFAAYLEAHYDNTWWVSSALAHFKKSLKSITS